MEKIQIKFNDVADVNKFVHVVSGYDSDVDLYCGSYCVDAKSILGFKLGSSCINEKVRQKKKKKKPVALIIKTTGFLISTN